MTSARLPVFRMSCAHCEHAFDVEYKIAVAAGYLASSGIECPLCGRPNRGQFLKAVAMSVFHRHLVSSN
jgi:hypothetical protein